MYEIFMISVDERVHFFVYTYTSQVRIQDFVKGSF